MAPQHAAKRRTGSPNSAARLHISLNLRLRLRLHLLRLRLRLHLHLRLRLRRRLTLRLNLRLRLALRIRLGLTLRLPLRLTFRPTLRLPFASPFASPFARDLRPGTSSSGHASIRSAHSNAIEMRGPIGPSASKSCLGMPCVHERFHGRLKYMSCEPCACRSDKTPQSAAAQGGAVCVPSGHPDRKPSAGVGDRACAGV